QRIEAPSRLGERDHVADGVRARQKSTNTVPAECDSAVGRSAVFERFEQEAEFFMCFAVVYPHQCENAFLHVEPVNTDRSAADLVAVALDVIGPRQGALRMLVKRIRILWRGERMVDRRPLPGARGDVSGGRGIPGGFEYRRVDNLDQPPCRSVDAIAFPFDPQIGGAEQGTGL